MKRYNEFRGTLSRLDYDAERGTFETVFAVHPFLDAEEAKHSSGTLIDVNGEAAPGSEAHSAVQTPEPHDIRTPDAGQTSPQAAHVARDEFAEFQLFQMALTA